MIFIICIKTVIKIFYNRLFLLLLFKLWSFNIFVDLIIKTFNKFKDFIFDWCIKGFIEITPTYFLNSMLILISLYNWCWFRLWLFLILIFLLILDIALLLSLFCTKVRSINLCRLFQVASMLCLIILWCLLCLLMYLMLFSLIRMTLFLLTYEIVFHLSYLVFWCILTCSLCDRGVWEISNALIYRWLMILGIGFWSYKTNAFLLDLLLNHLAV
jgi:hypothetical protein